MSRNKLKKHSVSKTVSTNCSIDLKRFANSVSSNKMQLFCNDLNENVNKNKDFFKANCRIVTYCFLIKTNWFAILYSWLRNLTTLFWSSKAWLAGQQAKARARLMIFCRLFCSISLIDMIWWATWFMDFFWGLRYTVLRLFVQLWDYYCTLGYIFISHDIHKVGDY